MGGVLSLRAERSNLIRLTLSLSKGLRVTFQDSAVSHSTIKDLLPRELIASSKDLAKRLGGLNRGLTSLHFVFTMQR